MRIQMILTTWYSFYLDVSTWRINATESNASFVISLLPFTKMLFFLSFQGLLARARLVVCTYIRSAIITCALIMAGAPKTTRTTNAFLQLLNNLHLRGINLMKRLELGAMTKRGRNNKVLIHTLSSTSCATRSPSWTSSRRMIVNKGCKDIARILTSAYTHLEHQPRRN